MDVFGMPHSYINMSAETLYLSFIHKVLATFLHMYVNYENGGKWN
jgi:hypothetical protein